nr:dipeptidyl aminopeptidase 4-like [Nerophis lumbriciformis]
MVRHGVTRRFSLGAPRSFSVADNGSSVLFLRSGGPEDPHNSLWILELGGEPRTLFDASGRSADELTKAERARRERAREQAGGVVSFVARPDHREVAFALGGELFLVSDEGGETPLNSDGNAFDPRFDPRADRVAYVSGSTLRITDGENDRLVPGTDEGGDLVSWGSSEFVAAEEMGRARGYWWAPSGGRMAACRVDTEPVDEWWISSPEQPSLPPRAIRYPSAGTDNADVQLWVIDVDSGERHQLDWSDGGFEYLADVQWLEVGDDELVRCTVQTRDQKTLAIFDFDPVSGERTERQRITDSHWVELQAGTPRQSELGVLTIVDEDTRRIAIDGSSIDHEGLNVRALVGVDDGLIIATVTTDGTDAVLARLGLDGAVEMLTDPGQNASAVSAGSTIVVTLARADADPTVEVRWSDGTVSSIESVADAPGFPCTPAFHTIGARALNAALCLPADHDGSPLPVLLDPYGGPHAQRVVRSRNAFATSQWFAEQGFAVVVVDGRGTPGRGPEFEREIWGDFATKILDDQIDALYALAEDRNELDLDRVGIRGWSFGGYLAALAVMRRPDAVHAAVAGAPVTDWLLYDTHYTERYIGHPNEHPDNYDRSSLISDAEDLTRPLMLIHGLADDNVVAAHTLRLSQALLEAGRAHEVLPLSGVTHMTPQVQVAENLLHLQRDFLQSHL